MRTGKRYGGSAPDGVFSCATKRITTVPVLCCGTEPTDVGLTSMAPRTRNGRQKHAALRQ